MKRTLSRLVMFVVTAFIGWKGYEAHRDGKIDLSGLLPSNITQPSTPSHVDVPPPPANVNTIKIASFNIQVFGESKLDKPAVVNVLARIIRFFDVVAIQEVRANTQDVLPRFVQQINAEGAHYSFVIGPRLGRTNSKEQYAYIYNMATVEIDRESIYTVNDPNDLLHREPFVAAFRARAAPPNEAFTFTLVDIHTDPDEAVKECDVLADVYRAVQNDGRGEDDILLLGDFNTDDHHSGRLGQIPYIATAISGVPSNTRGTKLYDNIFFDSRASTEYTGHSGVLNMMRQFNITMAEALEVSDHNPIWAEFSVREGGAPGYMATKPDAATTR